MANTTARLAPSVRPTPLLALFLLLGVLAGPAGPAIAGASFFVDDEPGWIAAWEAVAGPAPPSRIVSFETTSANIRLANEVSSNPGPNTWLAGTLTFERQNTGLCHDFQLRALEPGARFTFDDDEGTPVPDMDDALSVGDLDNYENDDFQITINGAAVYAVALTIVNSSAEAGEMLRVVGVDGTVLGALDASTLPSGTVSIGVVSDESIRLVRYDEGSGGDDIGFKALRFGDPTAYDSDGDGLSDCDETATLQYASSGSDSLDYQLQTAGSALFPGAELQGNTSGALATYDSMSIPQFDASLGTLTGVRLEFQGTGTLTHARSGLCETVIGIILCTFSIRTDTDVDFGIDIPDYFEGPSPPSQNGVPIRPMSAFWVSRSLLTDDSFFGAILNSTPQPSPPASITLSVDYDASGSNLSAFIGNDDVEIRSEIISRTALELDCEIAILAICDGAVIIDQAFSFGATVTYTYEPSTRVEFFVDDEAGWQSRIGNEGGQVAFFPTDPAGMLAANEVSSLLGRNTGVGNTLSFVADPEDACRSFTLRTLEAGANFTFDDDEGDGNLSNFDDALSVGDIDNRENDDFEISFAADEPPVYAVSFELRDSNSTNGETVRVYGESGELIGALGGASFTGSSPTLSILSEVPISRIVFDEDSGGDDIAVAAFAFDDPAWNDSDADGLVDCDEAQVYGTDAQVADSDADGLTDGDEVGLYGTSPTLADTDGDGFSDGDEVANGTNPLIPGTGAGVALPSLAQAAQLMLVGLLAFAGRRVVRSR